MLNNTGGARPVVAAGVVDPVAQALACMSVRREASDTKIKDEPQRVFNRGYRQRRRPKHTRSWGAPWGTQNPLK